MKNEATHSKLYGIILVLAASICFSGGGVAIKLIPWNALAINGGRNLISSVVIGLYILCTRHRLRFNTTVLIGAVSMAGVTTLYAIANKLTTAGNTIILQYTVPVWIILFMAIFFRERPTKLQVLTIAVVFAGILCFFFDSIGNGNLLGDICAVLSGIFYAGVFLLNSFEKGDALSSIFFGQLVCGLTLSPLIRFESDFSGLAIGGILFLGIIQVGLAYIFFSEGTKYVNPVTASLINGLEPVLNPILVALVYHELLTPMALVGAVIVFVAILSYNIISARSSQG